MAPKIRVSHYHKRQSDTVAIKNQHIQHDAVKRAKHQQYPVGSQGTSAIPKKTTPAAGQRYSKPFEARLPTTAEQQAIILELNRLATKYYQRQSSTQRKT